MLIRSQLSDYRPAALCKGREWVVKYYVRDEATGRMRRMREKLNHIADKAERHRFGLRRVKEINALLALGWNPHRDGMDLVKPRTVAEACDHFLTAKEREGREPDTLRSYRSCAGMLCQWLARSPVPKCTVSAFSEDLARAYMNASFIDRQLSPKAFNNYHTFYITLWNWFIEQGLVKHNVFRVVKKKPLPKEGSKLRPPTEEERRRIRAALEQEQPRAFAFLLLCFHCAIRPKEAFMLRPEHFRLEEQTIFIPGNISKNDRSQGVAVPDVLLPHLLALGVERQRHDHYVFSTRFQPGPKLKNSRYSGGWWNSVRKLADLPGEVTFYRMKHAGGEQLSRDGLEAVDLMNHFRHSDLKQTSIYTRRDYQKGVRTVIRKASPF